MYSWYRLKWMDNHFGMFDRITDTAYIMDDYGNAIQTSWGMPDYYWQEI